MYYFLYGEDFYSLKKKINAIKEKFKKTDPSLLNIADLSGADLSENNFWTNVLAAPFLASKRLTIVSNFLLENKDDNFKKNLVRDLAKIPESSLVFFVEDGIPDRRGALFKALNKPGIFQKFDLPSSASVGALIDEKTGEAGIKISNDAKNTLILYVGSNLYRAENEITKLILYTQSQNQKNIEVSLVEGMVQPEKSAGIFDFVDAIGSRNQKSALINFHKLIEAGENELYILSMIVYQFRIMLSVQGLLNNKIPGSSIAKAASIHPFVVTKTINLLRKYSQADLVKKFIRLGETDFAIKSGQIDAKLSILLLISDFCRG